MRLEGIVIILMLVFSTAPGSMMLWKISHMIKSSIDKNKVTISEEYYERLACAFIQHKKEMKQRVEILEAVIAGKRYGRRGSIPANCTGNGRKPTYN